MDFGVHNIRQSARENQIKNFVRQTVNDAAEKATSLSEGQQDFGKWFDDGNSPTPENIVDIIRPARYKLLIRPKPPRSKTDGNILVPDENIDTQAYRECRGKIVAVGETVHKDLRSGQEFYGTRPKVGMWVIFPRMAYGARLTVRADDGGMIKLVLINDDEIYAYLGEPDRIVTEF